MFTVAETMDSANTVGCHRCWKITNGTNHARKCHYLTMTIVEILTVLFLLRPLFLKLRVSLQSLLSHRFPSSTILHRRGYRMQLRSGPFSLSMQPAPLYNPHIQHPVIVDLCQFLSVISLLERRRLIWKECSLDSLYLQSLLPLTRTHTNKVVESPLDLVLIM